MMRTGKVYLAGSCDSNDRTRMKNIAAFLRKKGLIVYCPFDFKVPNAWDMTQELWALKVFKTDIDQIKNCDMMVVISTGRESTAGTNWEQGYAFGIGKPVYVFQVTDKPTSVMTFGGCTNFWNSSEECIYDQLEAWVHMQISPGECITCLT